MLRIGKTTTWCGTSPSTETSTVSGFILGGSGLQTCSCTTGKMYWAPILDLKSNSSEKNFVFYSNLLINLESVCYSCIFYLEIIFERLHIFMEIFVSPKSISFEMFLKKLISSHSSKCTQREMINC